MNSSEAQGIRQRRRANQFENLVHAVRENLPNVDRDGSCFNKNVISAVFQKHGFTLRFSRRCGNRQSLLLG